MNRHNPLARTALPPMGASQSMSIDRRRAREQSIAFAVIWLMGLTAAGLLLWIVGYILYSGIRVIDLEFLTTRPAGGVSGEGGMSTTIVTTLYLVTLTLAFATPLGVGAGIYLVEYAAASRRQSRWFDRAIGAVETGIEILAGIPSILYGLFGFTLFVSFLKLNFSLLSASLAGACLVLPAIVRTTQEALMAVPPDYRAGSLALGTTQWQTTWNAVLPAAFSGIATGIVLSAGRIVAETAVFWVTLGGSYRLPQNLLSSGANDGAARVHVGHRNACV